MEHVKRVHDDRERNKDDAEYQRKSYAFYYELFNFFSPFPYLIKPFADLRASRFRPATFFMFYFILIKPFAALRASRFRPAT
jgi:membrane-anchored glycerophosphoryl diester phosphodiesterase (GDPDase)